MQMKPITFAAAALAAVFAFAEAQPLASSAAEAGSATNSAALSRRIRRSPKYLGGFLTKPSEGKVVRVANAQQLVPAEKLKATADSIMQAVGVTLEVSPLADGEAAPETLLDDKTGVVVVLKASAKPGARVTVAPEDAWAVVDVAALSRDNPDADKLAQRVHKELWRAVAMVLGASDSNYRPCLMAPVHSLEDLDRLTARQVCPEPYMKMSDNAKALGCGYPVHVSYRTACREGWAPAPTNDIQRAIWNEIKDPASRWDKDFGEKK